jgi:hypothetical protein
MGQFRPLSDVRHSETTPPVVEAFTMSVATVDALDATQCTLEHSFGVSPQRPRNRRARRANAFRRYPRSLRREESAKATLSPLIIANSPYSNSEYEDQLNRDYQRDLSVR